MRILFVTFYDPFQLGIRALAAFMKQCGHEVMICQLKDFRHTAMSPMGGESSTGYALFSRWGFATSGDDIFPITATEMALFENAIAEWKPDVVGVTNRGPYNHMLATLIPVIRRAAPQSFIVGGGFGPTYNPEIGLHVGVDAVIRGEGEHALQELVEALESGKDWRHIRNLAYLEGETVCINPLRPLITALDEMPFSLCYGDHFISIEDDKLCRTDMRFRSYDPNYAGYPILGGRGCVGHCSYCAGGHWRNLYKSQGLNAPPIRERSLEHIFAELLVAKAHKEKEIVFNDEYFVRPIGDLIQFFKRYAQEIQIPFFAHVHHKQLFDSPELLYTLKDAQLRTVSFGLQSGSETFAREIYNRRNDNQEMLASLAACQKAGFSCTYHFIGGNLLETEADLQELFNFAAQTPFDPSLQAPVRLHSTKLKAFEGVPLTINHPELLTAQYDVKEWARSVLLAELRNKVAEKTFESICQDSFYAERPDRLLYLLHTTIHDLHYQYLFKEIERLKGREVYFWGCGEMYHYKRHLFNECKPRCILVNTGEYPDTLDGLPVKHPNDVLPHGDVLPIITFTESPNTICRTIGRKYPQYADIVSCACL